MQQAGNEENRLHIRSFLCSLCCCFHFFHFPDLLTSRSWRRPFLLSPSGTAADSGFVSVAGPAAFVFSCGWQTDLACFSAPLVGLWELPAPAASAHHTSRTTLKLVATSFRNCRKTRWSSLQANGVCWLCSTQSQRSCGVLPTWLPRLAGADWSGGCVARGLALRVICSCGGFCAKRARAADSAVWRAVLDAIETVRRQISRAVSKAKRNTMGMQA